MDGAGNSYTHTPQAIGGSNEMLPTRLDAGTSRATTDAPGELSLLAVVVITRNEARNIAGCLEAVLEAARPFPHTRVVVVDSDSDDDTTAIATRYPVEVYRYRAAVRTAAAGRRIGADLVRARYALFVDGDSRLAAEWLPLALARLDADPGLALVTGRRRDVYEGEGAAGEDAGFGGTALYRFAALQAVGGFHPYLTAEEEGEILGRLRAAGYGAMITPELMITHYTVRKDSWRGTSRRLSRGMMLGAGQVLRVALRDGLFTYHARRLNRALATLGYVITGAVLIAAMAFGAPAWLAETWVALGIALFVVLWWRHGEGIRAALYLCWEWLLGAAGIAAGFARAPRDARSFVPCVEIVSAGGTADSAHAPEATPCGTPGNSLR